MSVSWEKLLTVDDVKYRTVNFDLTTRGTSLGVKGPIFLNENMDMVSGTGVSTNRNYIGDWSESPAFNDGRIVGVAPFGVLAKECVDETGLVGTDTACSYFTWPNSTSYPGQTDSSVDENGNSIVIDLDIDLIESFMGGTVAVPLGVNSHGMHELECSFIFSNESESTDYGPSCLPSVSVWRAYAPATASFPTTSLRFVLVATPTDLKRNPQLDGGSYYINAPDHGGMNSFTFRKNIRVQSGSGDQDAGIVCYYAFGLHSFGSTTNGWVSFDAGDPHASSNQWPVTTGAAPIRRYSVRAEGSIRYKSH